MSGKSIKDNTVNEDLFVCGCRELLFLWLAQEIGPEAAKIDLGGYDKIEFPIIKEVKNDS